MQNAAFFLNPITVIYALNFLLLKITALCLFVFSELYNIQLITYQEQTAFYYRSCTLFPIIPIYRRGVHVCPGTKREVFQFFL